MPHAARTSSKRAAVALAAALATCLAVPAGGLAATSLSVDVTPARPATTPAGSPVELAIRAALSAAARGTLPPTLRALSLAMPAGFQIALADVPPCSQDVLELRGPAACPTGSRIGAGSASFVYVAGALRISATTRELSVFRGPGTAILVYVRVTQPTTFAVVLTGTLEDRPAPAGPRLSLDLARIARIEGGGSAVVTRLAVDLSRGLRSGPCPWTFTARLNYAGGGGEERAAAARCESGPDTTPPVLRASARDGTAAAGARLHARLSEAATVRVTLERRAGARWVRVSRTSFQRPAGASVLRIGGTLKRGRYRARLRATDAAGLLSAKRTVAFALR